MAKGEDTSRHPRRRVDNIVYANFGKPTPANAIDIMKLKDLPSDHPVFGNSGLSAEDYDAIANFSEADEVAMSNDRDDAPVHGIPRPSTNDDAPVHGIPRPKLSKKDMDY